MSFSRQKSVKLEKKKRKKEINEQSSAILQSLSSNHRVSKIGLLDILSAASIYNWIMVRDVGAEGGSA